MEKRRTFVRILQTFSVFLSFRRGMLANFVELLYNVLNYTRKEVLTLSAQQASKAGRPKNQVHPVNSVLLAIVYFFFNLYFLLCGMHVKAVNRVGTPEKPAIILCNHGSFVDFLYAATLLRKFKPHFVTARLYFYDNRLRWLLSHLGCFPKSMFAMDLESTKNCIKVLHDGQYLAMMPEARLSTAGRFEDIQEGTYTFIKKSAVPVYTLKFNGDYLANPKWGNGPRRGSVVEAELDILFTAQQVSTLSTQELKKGIEERLYFDEFQWLSQRPHIRYRNRDLAEGLQNILIRCPVCNRKYTITTKGRTISCEHCGKLTTLDSRYGFTGDFRFENLAQWYDWQKALLEKEILGSEDYALVSPVQLRLPSYGKGLTRSAGSGICTLNREGLTYAGTRDGETVTLHFSYEQIYRLLFGAGENFEVYVGTQIFYFVPDERRSAVAWYMASMILRDLVTGNS